MRELTVTSCGCSALGTKLIGLMLMYPRSHEMNDDKAWMTEGKFYAGQNQSYNLIYDANNRMLPHLSCLKLSA